MDKEIFELSRIPYYVEDINSDRIIPKTIVVDFNTKKGYINSAENNKKLLCYDDIDMKIRNKIKKIKNRASIRGNTLKKLEERMEGLTEWIDDIDNITSDGSITSVYDLLKLFKDMNIEEDTIKEQLKRKVLRREGKVLSEVNFNDDLKNKLDNIEIGANKYIHPTEKQCNFVSKVTSINGKVGDVILTKNDIGLEDFDLTANNYTHPDNKVCLTDSIISVNGKKGIVKLTLEDLELNKLIDAKVIENDMLPITENSYITPYSLLNYLKKSKTNIKTFLDERLLNKTIKIKAYAGTVLESNLLIKRGDFISTAKIEVIYKDKKISETGEIEVTLEPGDYIISVKASGFFDNVYPIKIDENIKNGMEFKVFLDEFYEEYNLNIPDNAKYIRVISDKDTNPIIKS